MRVQFDFDIDDLVDTSARKTHRSPSARRRVLARRAGSSAAMGVVAGLIPYTSLPGLAAAAPQVALATAAVVVVIQWVAYGIAMKRSLRGRYLAMYGSEGPFTCTVELTREGVVVRQLNAQNLHEWATVISIEETAGSIDFRSGTRYLVVRDRAFRSDEERDAFLATARRYHETYARVGDGLPP